MKLVREVRGSLPLEDVESDEAEGGVLMMAREVDVLAGHDTHIRIECEIAELAFAGTDGMSGRHAAVEVEDGRGVAGAEEVEVEMHAADVRGTRHRLWSTR